MSSQHILIKAATRKPYKETPTMPKQCEYSPSRGVWLVRNEPLVLSDEAEELTTKKCDQETGEDQKGE